GEEASQHLQRQLLRTLCPQAPPLRADAVPEGGASIGVAPTSASHARRQPRLLAAALATTVVPAGNYGCWRLPPCGWPPLQAALATCIHPYGAPGRSRPCLAVGMVMAGRPSSFRLL
ncbi:hypothetical protein B296_00025511, partial [Ensete ventricosum]